MHVAIERRALHLEDGIERDQLADLALTQLLFAEQLARSPRVTALTGRNCWGQTVGWVGFCYPVDGQPSCSAAGVFTLGPKPAVPLAAPFRDPPGRFAEM